MKNIIWTDALIKETLPDFNKRVFVILKNDSGEKFIHIAFLSHLKISIFGTEINWLHPLNNGRITNPFYWANLPEMPNSDNDNGWIDTSIIETLPGFETPVLLIVKGRTENYITIGYLASLTQTLNGTKSLWLDNLIGGIIYEALYWQYLPDMPEMPEL